MSEKPYLLHLLLAVAILTVIFSACRKEDAISDNPNLKLEFSTDSVIFDTVFTSLGSATLAADGV